MGRPIDFEQHCGRFRARHNLRATYFLYIARGSAGEVRSMLSLLERIQGFADLKSEISNLKSLAEGISRQLRGWADSLQNSGIKGQRYLTDKNFWSASAKSKNRKVLTIVIRSHTRTDSAELKCEISNLKSATPRWKGRASVVLSASAVETHPKRRTGKKGFETYDEWVKAALWQGLLAKDFADFARDNLGKQ